MDRGYSWFGHTNNIFNLIVFGGIHLQCQQHLQIHVLVQDYSNYSASAMELLQSCTEP